MLHEMKSIFTMHNKFKMLNKKCQSYRPTWIITMADKIIQLWIIWLYQCCVQTQLTIPPPPHTHTHDDTSPNQVMMSALDTSLLILIDIFFTHVRWHLWQMFTDWLIISENIKVRYTQECNLLNALGLCEMTSFLLFP